MVLYPNKLPESERVCSGICSLKRRVDLPGRRSGKKRGWSTGIKKGVPLYSNLFINLKSNTMKTRCKGTGFPVNCKSFQKKNMFNNIF